MNIIPEMSPTEKSKNEAPSSKVEKLFQKVYNLVCCNDFCREWCDCCWEDQKTKKKRITKDDIQHIVNHQPVTATLSDTSRSSISTSASSQSYSFSSSSVRDRLDSDNSSRKESISSSPELRKPHVKPVIDMKPIEFWTANREAVQPRTPRRRLPSESEFSLDSFQLDLYESTDSSDEPQTDEEKLARYGLGQVHFSLQYEIPMKILKVKIIEARELCRPYHQDSNKQDMAHSNPYVKVALLPDQKNSRQTTVKRKTQAPCWNETFAFELPFTEAQRRTLEITLKDFDKYSRHCVIGQVHLPLANINLVKGGHMWKPLLPCHKSQPDLGELLLSLNYLPSAGRLNVDIIKAQQLLQTDLVGGSDPFVKVSLLQHGKVLKTRKTSIKKNTIDPVFNESINFNVTPDMLESISLVITVWDYNSKSRDDFVGRIVLGKQATGAYEVTHWNRMMQCHRSPVAQWHTLRPREDCEISSASPSVS